MTDAKGFMHLWVAFRLCEINRGGVRGVVSVRALDGATVSIQHRNRQHLAAQCCTERGLLTNHLFFRLLSPSGCPAFFRFRRDVTDGCGSHHDQKREVSTLV